MAAGCFLAARWSAPLSLDTSFDPPAWPALPLLGLVGIIAAITPAFTAPQIPSTVPLARLLETDWEPAR
jgi:hypothetical protein